MNHIATLITNSAATWTLRKGMTALLLAGVCGSALTTARAASYTFDANTSTTGPQDGSGTWNTTLANFWNGTSDVQWPNQNTDVAVFGAGAGGGIMTITTGNVTTNGITFATISTTTGTYYQTLGGTITLAGTDPTITVNATNGGTIRSALVGTSGFIKTGSAGLSIGADADLSGLSGTVRVDAGAVFLSANSAAATWQINSNTATLALSSNTTVSIGALSGVAGATLRTAGSTLPTASIGALNTDSTYAGKITGTIAITKVGTGTLTLSGSGNNYTGATTVSQGTLLLSGSAVLTYSTSVEVQSGATLDVSGVTGGVYTFGAAQFPAQLLKGAGTIKGNSIVNGSLQPGSSPGILSFANNLTLANTTQTTIDLASGTRGTNFDGINVGGALGYDGTLTFSIGAALLNGTYNIFDFASTSGALDLVAFSGGVYAGTFVYDGTALWTASDTNGSGQTFTFDQASGDLTVVPEPNSWTLALCGAIFGLLLMRRRKDAARD